MEEGRGGKEKKRRTTREEDRRWQRLPWPGPHTSSMEPNYEAGSSQRFGEPIHQAPAGPQSSSREQNHQCPQSSSMGPNHHQIPQNVIAQTSHRPLLEKTLPRSSWGESDNQPPVLGSKQLKKNTSGLLAFENCNQAKTWKPLGCRLVGTWKLPGCHLVAAIIIALLSILIRPTVGGEHQFSHRQ